MIKFSDAEDGVGTLVGSHVVDGVLATTSTLELGEAPSVEVAHVGVGKVHESKCHVTLVGDIT